jgi:predicted CopG family antitoxin
MTSKNIAVREDVYKKLLESKEDDESFSDSPSMELLDNAYSAIH